ncbi:hypothetical protein JCM5296_000758 [Sporobolomyces johnsonii]
MSPSPNPPSKPKAPSLGRNASPAERQAHALNKLLANPDREIHIPQRPQEGVAKTLRPPREMMKNVQGSSAGAGSGEFHVYKQSRRREYERLKLMDEEEAFLKAKREAEERQAAHEAAALEKTAKNRLKRQRKKDARSKHKGSGSGADGGGGGSDAGESPGPAAAASAGGEGEGGDKRRKLAGGAALRFKTAEEREAEGAEEDDARAGEGPAAPGEDEALRRLQEEEQERAAPAKEAGIVIQDDD